MEIHTIGIDLGKTVFHLVGLDVAELSGLRSVQDYIQNFQLHLPEIYEETILVEHYSSAFRGTQSNSALTWMLTGLEHLGRNHSYFVQPALDLASDEDSWTE